MDLVALMEVLRQKYGEVQLTPGREYSVNITPEEAIKIIGEAPETPTAYDVSLKRTPDGKYEVAVERQEIN
jgi:hypothetical protein